jgi:hypothetical protein
MKKTNINRKNTEMKGCQFQIPAQLAFDAIIVILIHFMEFYYVLPFHPSDSGFTHLTLYVCKLDNTLQHSILATQEIIQRR